MRILFLVDIDESETNFSMQQLADFGLEALSNEYEKLGCECDIGYNPEMISPGKFN